MAQEEVFPPPPQVGRDILPMSTGVPILPWQSAQIIGHPYGLVSKVWRFVISNAGTAGGSADWIVNDLKINNVSQFGDVRGNVFATDVPDEITKLVRVATIPSALDVVTVAVTYIGLNEMGCPFFGALVGMVIDTPPV